MRFIQALSLAVFVSILASTAYALNPQPEPPGVQLNPQPEPPGATDSAASPGNKLNPQPEPPGVAGDSIHKDPSLTQGSDSSRDKHGIGKLKRDPSLTHGSDSSEKKHRLKKPSLSQGSDSSEKKHKPVGGPPTRDTGGGDTISDPGIGIGEGAGR